MKYSSSRNFLYALLSLALTAPLSLAHAADSLIPCGAKGGTACKFSDLFILVNNVIKFLVFYLAAPLATIAIAWAGVILLTRGGDSGARSEARKILQYAIGGFVLALAAWLIISAITTALVKPEFNPLP